MEGVAPRIHHRLSYRSDKRCNVCTATAHLVKRYTRTVLRSLCNPSTVPCVQLLPASGNKTDMPWYAVADGSSIEACVHVKCHVQPISLSSSVCQAPRVRRHTQP